MKRRKHSDMSLQLNRNCFYSIMQNKCIFRMNVVMNLTEPNGVPSSKSGDENHIDALWGEGTTK